MEAEVNHWLRLGKGSDPPRSSQSTASTDEDDQDSVANFKDPGVEDEPANPTLTRFQGSWLTHKGS